MLRNNKTPGITFNNDSIGATPEDLQDFQLRVGGTEKFVFTNDEETGIHPLSHDDSLKEKLRHFININSIDNQFNTPDFVLAEYLHSCLKSFEEATKSRAKWYGEDY